MQPPKVDWCNRALWGVSFVLLLTGCLLYSMDTSRLPRVNIHVEIVRIPGATPASAAESKPSQQSDAKHGRPVSDLSSRQDAVLAALIATNGRHCENLTLVDVGAVGRGDDMLAVHLSTRCGDYWSWVVHLIEPSHLFRILEPMAARDSRFLVHHIAVGMGSETSDSITIDRFMERSFAPHVNLLKVTIDDSQASVIESATRSLNDGRIDVVSFNFVRGSKQFLWSITLLALANAGFTTYALTGACVPIRFEPHSSSRDLSQYTCFSVRSAWSKHDQFVTNIIEGGCKKYG